MRDAVANLGTSIRFERSAHLTDRVKAEERSQRWLKCLVLGVWLLATFVAFQFSIRSTRVLPYWDECELVDFVAGVRPVTLDWMWDQHNEHRIPLVKLIMVGIARATGMNGTLTICISTALIAASAGLMLLFVHGLRGRFSAWDCAIPVAFLNPAHGQTYSEPFQLTWTLPVFLGCTAVYLGVRASQRQELWSLLAAGGAIVLLPLCGATMLPTALMGAATLAVTAHRRWHGELFLQSVASGLLALLTAGLIAVYPIGLNFPEHVPGQVYPMGFRLLHSTAEATSNLFGTPYVNEGYTRDVFGKSHAMLLGAFLMLAVGVALSELGREVRKDTAKPEWALWIATPLLGIMGTALLLGYGRAWSPVATRYTIIFVPVIPLLMAVVCQLPQRSFARLTALAVCFLVIFAVPKNYRWGKQFASENRDQNRKVIAELGASPSMEAFIARVPKIYPDADRVSVLVRTLADHHMSLFRKHTPPASWKISESEVADRTGAKARH